MANTAPPDSESPLHEFRMWCASQSLGPSRCESVFPDEPDYFGTFEGIRAKYDQCDNVRPLHYVFILSVPEWSVATVAEAYVGVCEVMSRQQMLYYQDPRGSSKTLLGRVCIAEVCTKSHLLQNGAYKYLVVDMSNPNARTFDTLTRGVDLGPFFAHTLETARDPISHNLVEPCSVLDAFKPDVQRLQTSVSSATAGCAVGELFKFKVCTNARFLEALMLSEETTSDLFVQAAPDGFTYGVTYDSEEGVFRFLVTGTKSNEMSEPLVVFI